MLQQIEQQVFEIYKRILLRSNFKPGVYSFSESRAICSKVSNYHTALSFYTMQTGVKPSPETLSRIAKIQALMCN